MESGHQPGQMPSPMGRISRDDELVLRQLHAFQPQVGDLLRLWRERNERAPVWRRPATHLLLAKHFIDLGAPFSAREVAEAGLALASDSRRFRARLRHLFALSLARCGMLAEASRALGDEALAALPSDEEVRGLEAAVHKQLGLRAASPADRETHLRRGLSLYEAAWRTPRGTYWTGINVAALQRLLGETEAAADTARQVEVECLAEAQRSSAAPEVDPYWRWATLGEACLIQGRLQDAEQWYRRAESVAHGRVGHLNSSRRQLKQLLRAIGEAESLVDDWLPIPNVAIFTGHRVDEAHRSAPRFPPEREPHVRAALMKWLEDNRIRVGVSSAANGADILFLETLQSLKGSDTRVVLPFSEDQFIRESVLNGVDESWAPRFRAVLAKASHVTIACHDRVGSEGVPFAYANQLILGQGRLLAEELQTSLRGLAVLGRSTSTARGGTADAVTQWRRRGLAVEVLDPLRCEPQLLADAADRFVDGDSADDAPVMSMIFADVVGYSQLADSEVTKFVDLFLGRVAKRMDRYADPRLVSDQWRHTLIPVRETWGDGLYFACRKLCTAGLFALDLCEEVRDTNWRELGFSNDLKIRIALHAGPVHLGRDPITGLPKCSGAHVSRAARLEPKTPPNQVYASDAFASLAAAQGITEFVCDYVKLIDWAKHYGTYPTYAVRRTADASGVHRPIKP
jgi:class 3 adenylate cyclase